LLGKTERNFMLFMILLRTGIGYFTKARWKTLELDQVVRGIREESLY